MGNIWSSARRSLTTQKGSSDHRTPYEHDFDRLLFSAPVRRLADKTQVFPLDRSDAVRTRLTHSHEVSNLARSMGNRLIHEGFRFAGLDDPKIVPTILSTIGLAHDLGNPPFGHQGEAAIGNWFTKNHTLLSDSSADIPIALHSEFTEFEGNAQAFRMLTRLQVALGGYGLDFTASTLAALLKYPVTCDLRNKSMISSKKYGYFESEQEIIEWVRRETGLQICQRHPLAWLMEAADDIAYAVLDIEDAMHKGIVSPDDVRALINHHLDATYSEMTTFLDDKFLKTRNLRLSISATREIMASYLRTAFIGKLIDETIESYKEKCALIFSYNLVTPILENSSLLTTLKSIAQNHVFTSPDVRKVEADGFKIIGGLMDFYWHAISHRKEKSDLLSRRLDARAAFGISKLSDNYLQCAAKLNFKSRTASDLPMRYHELRLLTDMISGMSDGYAKAEYDFLKINELLSNE